MGAGPSGTLTLLFTDIEGSTRAWESSPGPMSDSLARHDAVLREGIEARGGRVFKTVGDAFCAAFRQPLAALETAIAIQHALASEPWQIEGGIRVRMSLHAGAAEERDDDYFGPVLNRTARILSLAQGGQILCSLAASELLRDHLPPNVQLEELGSFRLKDLYRPELLSQVQAPGLRERFPALKSLDGLPNNLPLQPGVFFGRETELEAIRAAFRGGSCRLLSLVACGGAGKTRLALQAAADLLEGYEGGAWFIDLSACTDGREAARATNRALGVREREGVEPEEALRAHLAQARLLLVLDNLEQDHEAGALITSLLGSCPSVDVIATSRAALRIRWERVLPLPPLGLPERGTAVTLASLSQYESVALFIDRARAASPAFAVNERNAPAIAQICVKLEGIPLAIELAAARVMAFEPEAILHRFEADPDFLDSGASDLPARQRTLRAAAQWSYRLLKPMERNCYAALGIFAGPFSLESAEAVLLSLEERRCAEGGAKRTKAAGRSALDSRIASLVDKSLLVREEGLKPEGDRVKVRYRMLETLRAYARERLEAGGELEAARDAHACRFLDLARRGRGEAPNRMGEAEFYSGIDAEYADYAAAWDWLAERKRGEEALELANGLARYWELRGAIGEGKARLEKSIALAPKEKVALRAAGEAHIGEFLRMSGDFEGARELFERSRGEFATLGDPAGEARGLVGAGWCRYYQGDASAARECFSDALDLASRSDCGIEGAYARQGLGWLHLAENDIEQARSTLGMAFEGFMTVSELISAARVAGNLAIAATREGDRHRARIEFQRTKELFELIGDRECTVISLNNLACFEAEEGNHETALEILTAVETLSRAIGMTKLVSLSLTGQSDSLEALGRHDEALAAAMEAEGIASRRGFVVERGVALRSKARAKLSMNDPCTALQDIEEAIGLLNRASVAVELEEAVKLRRRIVDSSSPV